MSNTTNINIKVELDENKTPAHIEWSADSNDGDSARSSKAMLLSFFDRESLETFKIDLWTKDLQLAEMDRLMFNTLKALADTYFNATKNEDLSNQFRSFVQHFGAQTGILKK